MSAPDDLKPQVPGNVLEPDAKPTRDPLLDLAALAPAKLIPTLGELTASELQTLAAYERTGRKREKVLAAIERAMQPKPVKPVVSTAQLQRAVEPRPRYGGMTLTDAGWVVREPETP